MKSCTYCGRAHPDEASVCAIDGQPLQPAILPKPGPDVEGKNSPLGVVSFGISVAVGCLMLGLFIVGGMLNAGRVEQGKTYPGQMIVGFIAIFLLAADVVAAGLGIAAICQEGRKRLFGVLGLVFSSATILGSIGLIVLGLMYTARLAR